MTQPSRESLRAALDCAVLIDGPLGAGVLVPGATYRVEEVREHWEPSGIEGEPPHISTVIRFAAAPPEPLREGLDPWARLRAEIEHELAVVDESDPFQAGAAAAYNFALSHFPAAPPEPLREALHTLLWPPHPGNVYESSALCSCGEWQFDSGSPGALFNETRLILQEWTEHAAPPEPLREALDVRDFEGISPRDAYLSGYRRGQLARSATPPTEGLDVERLRAAMTLACDFLWASKIAAEYAALSEPHDKEPG